MDRFALNPKTGRLVKVGGKTYKQLLSNGLVGGGDGLFNYPILPTDGIAVDRSCHQLFKYAPTRNQTNTQRILCALELAGVKVSEQPQNIKLDGGHKYLKKRVEYVPNSNPPMFRYVTFTHHNYKHTKIPVIRHVIYDPSTNMLVPYGQDNQWY